MVTAITAVVEPLGVRVYAHRRLSLAVDQDELPAISVDFGEDNPAQELTGAYFDSLLSVQIAAIAAASEETDLKTELLDLRRRIAVALMADRTLGLAFVVNTHYGGTEAPQIDASVDPILGELVSVWNVYYRMNIADPGD
jgi:hypothetical protein